MRTDLEIINNNYEKVCVVCGKNKSLDDFYYHKLRTDKRQPLCKICDKERSKKYYKDNNIRIIERHWQWIKNNRERHNQIATNYREREKQKVLNEYKI